ncbi:adhesion G protein-coupled receptor E3-like isoform X3 [Neoarius graeffei]|uniref:adhesion G protein-coupled receptor E3-like isoform X3 n=1 Tax=Neoarius graeffei TaxID=443677 RepID=UPI00298C10C4|nr:adhesion G protein-coupled receptor E3-like isoform X3 [Neoarius graeffei]
MFSSWFSPEGVAVLLLTIVTTFDASLPDVNLTLPEKCQVDLLAECALEWALPPFQNGTVQEPLQDTVESHLNKIMVLITLLKDFITDRNILLSYGNCVLEVTENLVSMLVRKTDPIKSINISLQTLEVQVITVGQNTSVNKVHSLITSSASMDIELTGISKNSSVAVAFMSYTNMSDILTPVDLDDSKTMMSAVVSVTLLQTTNAHLTKPLNLTFTNIRELDPADILYCGYWTETDWAEAGCNITDKNSTHTVCSCDHLGTFTIMQVLSDQDTTDHSWIIFVTASIAVGIIFLILSILTLAFCWPNRNLTRTALINLCISLLMVLLFDLAFLHTQTVWKLVLDWLWDFFYLSFGLWMFIEAILLFISVKNLSNIRSMQGEGFSWKWLIVIGYCVPLIVVTLLFMRLSFTGSQTSVEENWDSEASFVVYSIFLCILAFNFIFFFIIIINLSFTIIRQKLQNLQRSNTNNQKLILCVMFKSLAQFFILGCPWIILDFFNDSTSWYVWMFFASQQGTFIFLVHCLFNQEVRQQYRKYLDAFCCASKRNTATADVQMSSDSGNNMNVHRAVTSTVTLSVIS